jgi:hypothetical protein
METSTCLNFSKGEKVFQPRDAATLKVWPQPWAVRPIHVISPTEKDSRRTAPKPPFSRMGLTNRPTIPTASTRGKRSINDQETLDTETLGEP